MWRCQTDGSAGSGSGSAGRGISTSTDGAWHLVAYGGPEQRAFERLSIPPQVAFAYLATVVAGEHRRTCIGDSHAWFGDLGSELEPVVCIAHVPIDEELEVWYDPLRRHESACADEAHANGTCSAQLPPKDGDEGDE